MKNLEATYDTLSRLVVIVLSSIGNKVCPDALYVVRQFEVIVSTLKNIEGIHLIGDNIHRIHIVYRASVICSNVGMTISIPYRDGISLKMRLITEYIISSKGRS